MKKVISQISTLLMFFLISLFVFITGCKDETTVEPVYLTDEEAMQKIALEDSMVLSFDNNFNENENIDFLSKVQTQIYPRKVWRTAFLISSNLNLVISGDSALGVLTKMFESTLFIAAAFDSTSILPDTLIQKPFTNTITRNIIFKRINNSPDPLENWEIIGISMPEGGTENSNVEIKKLTAFLPDGEVIEIDSPNEYYFSINSGSYNPISKLHFDASITLRIELTSTYSDSDFVSLTYGSLGSGLHMAQKKFVMTSSTWDGAKWNRVYEQTFSAHQFPGFYHAIVNVIPKQVLLDDTFPVESNSWGMPYIIIF